MKKLIILLFLFGLIACGGQEKVETEQVAPEAMEMPAAQDTAAAAVDTTEAM